MTQQDAIDLKNAGWTDEEIANAIPVPKEVISNASTVGRIAKAHAGSYAGGGAGALAGMSPALPWNAAAIAAAPETLGVSLAVPAVSGIVGGLIGGYGGDKAQAALLGDETTARLQQEAAEAATQHPLTALGTDIVAGSLASGGLPSIKNLGGAARGIGALVKGEGTALNAERAALIGQADNALIAGETGGADALAAKLAANNAKLAKHVADRNALAKVALGAALNPAIATGTSLAEGRGLPSATELLGQAAGGAAFSESMLHGGGRNSVTERTPQIPSQATRLVEPVSEYAGGEMPTERNLGDVAPIKEVTPPQPEPAPKPVVAHEILQEVIAKGATKPISVRRIFPDMNLSIEDAAEILRQANDYKAKEVAKLSGVSELPAVEEKVIPAAKVSDILPKEVLPIERLPVEEENDLKGKVLNSPLSDYNRYKELQSQMAEMGQAKFGTPDFNALWQESESIKNRYGGNPPPESFATADRLPLDITQHIRSNKATSGSILEMLGNKDNHPHAKLAKALFDAADAESLNTPWLHDANLDLEGQPRSHYDLLNNRVNIGTENSMDSKVVLEEAIHSMTSAKIPDWGNSIGQAHYNKLNSYLQIGNNEAVKKLINAYFETAKSLGIHNDLFQDTPTGIDEHTIQGLAGTPDDVVSSLNRQDLGSITKYAMGNLDEFIAQAIKSPEFQRVLEGIKSTDGRNVWQKIVDAVREILGLSTKQGTLLNDVLRSSGELISQKRGESLDVNPSGARRFATEIQNTRPRDNKLLINAAEMVRNPSEKLGLRPNNSGAYNGTQLVGTLMNKLTPMEQDIYTKAGIHQAFEGKIITQEEAAKWLEENSPPVETVTYGMERKVSKAKKEYDRMTHEWYEQGSLQQHTVHTLEREGDVEKARSLLKRGTDPVQAKDIDKHLETAQKYLNLKKQIATEPRDTSPRATSYYNTVSALPANEPMPEWTTTKSGKNVQRVDVVIPLNDKLKTEGGAEYTTSRNTRNKTLWQPDNLHENLPNTLGWAMIQYKTGAKGEKIAVIAEAQSRWGQERRALDKYLKRDRSVEWTDDVPDLKTPKHELLNDYNRLILKAAIEQARKEGATHIVVSDAETAMMTEGHDILNEEDYIPGQGDAREADIEQAPGMRLNYDDKVMLWSPKDANGESHIVERFPSKEDAEAYARHNRLRMDSKDADENYKINRGDLHNIAEELTGSKGEKVSLGEHKNAYEVDDEHNPNTEHRDTLWKQPRSNLIFRNADGTPKTDVSGRMYALDNVPDRQPMQYGKRYTPPVAEETGNAADLRTIGQDNELTKPNEKAPSLVSRIFGKLQATNDRVAAKYPILGTAFNRFAALKSNITAWKDTAIVDLSKYPRELLDDVMAKHREAYRSGEEPTLNEKEKEVSDILSNYYGKIADTRREYGMKIDEREAGKNKYYVPDQLSGDVIKYFTKYSQGETASYYKKLWAKHVVKETNGRVSMDDALENINEYVRALSGSKANYNAAKFGAIRKAAGYGLPEGMRETDALAALDRYGNRAATDLAMYKELESNPEVQTLLELRNPVTNEMPVNKTAEASAPQDEDVRNAMKWVTGNLGTANAHPALTALIRVVNNGILGPATGLRDIAQVPVNMLPYVNSVSDLSPILKGITSIRANKRAALETGATKPTIDRIRFNDVNNAPDSFVAGAHKLGDLLRKYQGREALENLARDTTFSVGKEIAKTRVIEAANGDAKAVKWLQRFGTLVDSDITKLEGKALDDALNQTAKNFVDANQGTYNASGLPTGIVDSQLAPFLSMQKWSVEKANTLYKDVYKPFVSGENRIPLLTYTLGTVLTGAGIQELNKLLNNRKGQDPEVKEALEEGGIHSKMSELATLMSLSSYGGIVGDGLKFASDISNKKVPRSPVSFPTADAAADFVKKTSNVVEAINSGEEPIRVLGQYALDLATHNIQAARMIANRTINEDKMENADKFRDLRVFNELTGNQKNNIPNVNPYLNLETKDFKRAKSVEEAAQMLPAIINRIIKESDGDPYKLKRELSGLKSNSYQTIPNMESMPIQFVKYLQYLKNTQGEDAANARLMDYIQQNTINKAKSTLVP